MDNEFFKTLENEISKIKLKDGMKLTWNYDINDRIYY